MELIIKAKNKQTGQTESFSELDWAKMVKTGLYEYVTTTSVIAPVSRAIEPAAEITKPKAIIPKSSGCSKCGRKKK